MTNDPTRNDPQPLARLRDYELLARLGQGGMGAVYLARHAHLDKQVAVKLLPREHLRNSEMVARFKREMKAVGKLQHPNIIQAFDGGEEKGVHFLVLEYAEGLDLNVLLARYGKLPISDACEIIRQAAVGLEHAHLHGLVHRDIKPANLLLAWPSRRATDSATDDGDSDVAVTDEPRETVEWAGSGASSGLDLQPIVKVLDLGLALLNTDNHSLAQGITNTGQIMGTLDYMAPEQTSDTHTVDIRADIYSLGCTLYALLTGRPPFYGDQYSNAYQKIVAHNRESPRPLHEVRKNAPPAVAAVLNKMLAKNPDDRYSSPVEVAAALQPFCANNTLLATLVEAEARQAEHKAQSDATTQALNSSALEGTTNAAADDGAYALSHDDELLALLRATVDETIVSRRPAATQIKLNVEAAPTVKQVRRSRAADSSRLRLHLLAAAGCLVLGVIIAAVVFRIMTNYGTIELTLYHKDAQVTVDGDTVRLRPTGDDDHYEIRVAPGTHKLQVEKDGYTTFARELEIAKGEEKLVGVQLLRAGDGEIGRGGDKEKGNQVVAIPPPLPGSPSPALMEEPPPLDQWLAGREILTVKQDGTAMFTKIQDALDALKPGQVVEVLDKGPYIENLAKTLPDNCGLVTRVGTCVSLREWIPTPATSQSPHEFNGHALAGRFRLSGLVFHSELRHRAILLRLSGEVTFENCVFPNLSTKTLLQRSVSIGAGKNNAPRDIFIRNCNFGGDVYVGLYAGEWRLAVTHNCFRGPAYGLGVACFQASRGDHNLLVRQNLFDGYNNQSVNFGAFHGAFNLRGAINQNTILADRELVNIGHDIPTGPLLIRHNLIASERGVALTNGAEQFSDRVRQSVIQEWNGYAHELPDADGRPLSSSNVIAPLEFISLDPGSRDYARLSADSPHANMSRSDGNPTWAGAFPPGPAPAEGDWFTRLLERWNEAQADLKRMGLESSAETPRVVPATSNGRDETSPNLKSEITNQEFEEPPLLEEWLQGRAILTVKQDGSAMFTKIQEALDAAEPGQVVQILDRGPYRETLNLDGIGDGGLISNSQTVIEPADYKETVLNGEPLLIAHRAARDCDRMRIAGIDFCFHEERLTRGLEVKGGCVIEGCVFRFSIPSRREPHNAIDAIVASAARWVSPFVVRDCVIDGGTLHTYSYGNTSTSGAQFTRNLFIGDGGSRGKPLALSGGFGDVRCSECVFVAKGQHSITLVGHSNDDSFNCVFANNTILTTHQPAVSAYGDPIAGIRFENNVIVGPAFFGKGNAAEPVLFENWEARHNWFTDIAQPRDQSIVQQDPSNRSGPLTFLSTDANHRDFLRLPTTSPAATGGVGGGEATYLGALPPGPAPPEGDWFTRLLERWKEAREGSK